MLNRMNNTDKKTETETPDPDWDGDSEASSPEASETAELLKSMREEKEKREKEEKKPSPGKAKEECAEFEPGKDYGVRRTTSGEWYVRRVNRKRGVIWSKCTTREDVKHYLQKKHNIYDFGLRGDMTEADSVIEDVLDNFIVETAGEFAGYLTSGEYEVQNDTVLVVRGAPLIQPVKGDCEFYLECIKRTYSRSHTDEKGNVYRQSDAYLGWAQGAVVTLYNDKPGMWRHGQALIAIGDPGVGKTAFQHVNAEMLGGRKTNPELFFRDRTSFNAQMGEKENWIISDPKAKNKAEQEKFLGDLKTFVANVWMAIHPKGGKLIDLPTYRRMTVSLNRDNLALRILQNMAASDLDKVIILDFEDAGKYAPDGKDPGGEEGLRWNEWAQKMISQLPAFLWYLLNEYEVPAHMYDKRYNVAYHNPEIEPQLAVPSQNEADLELMEIVERGLFSYLNTAS